MNSLPGCSPFEAPETLITTSRSLSAIDSDSSHNLPWYAPDHSQDTSGHACLQSPPVQTSATNDLMHSHDPFDYTALNDITFSPSSDTSAGKAKLQQLAPTTPPQTLAHACHPDAYHVSNPLCHESAASQQHAFSACANGAILPETSHPAPHSSRYLSSTLDSACQAPLNLYTSKVPSLQGPSRDLSSTTTHRCFADCSLEFSRNPPPKNDPSGFSNPKQQLPLLTEPVSGFQKLGGSNDEVYCTSSSISVDRHLQVQTFNNGGATTISVIPSVMHTLRY